MRPDLSHLANAYSLELPEPAPLPVRDSVLDASEELDTLTNLALKNIRELLELEFDFTQPKLVNAKLAAATTTLNTQVRVDEGRLKRRQADALPKLLEMIRREEGRTVAVHLIEGELA